MIMVYCAGCGKELRDNVSFCPDCGTGMRNNTINNNTKLPRKSNGTIVTGEKSVGLAVILSLLIPGAGTMYAGKVGWGLVLLILSAALLFFIVGFFIWLYSIYDAYAACKEHNSLWYDYLESSGQA